MIHFSWTWHSLDILILHGGRELSNFQAWPTRGVNLAVLRWIHKKQNISVEWNKALCILPGRKGIISHPVIIHMHSSCIALPIRIRSLLLHGCMILWQKVRSRLRTTKTLEDLWPNYHHLCKPHYCQSSQLQICCGLFCNCRQTQGRTKVWYCHWHYFVEIWNGQALQHHRWCLELSWFPQEHDPMDTVGQLLQVDWCCRYWWLWGQYFKRVWPEGMLFSPTLWVWSCSLLESTKWTVLYLPAVRPALIGL